MRILTWAKYIFLTIIGLFFILFVLSWTHIYKASELEYGVTFSSQQSKDLGLDPKTVYLAMFDDLGVKKLRLAAYWDQLELKQNEYNWDELDWQISEAEKRNVELILVIGQRVPRWPECHMPDWAENANTEDRQSATLSYIKQVISRYKRHANIKYWQIENEPFLKYFGVCPTFDKNFLDKEIAEAKSLDTRPIVVTDSGELSLWIPAARRADVFGTTMYRDTYSKVFNSYIHYPIEPVFFRVKRNIANLFAHPQDWIVIELQGEPWGKKAFQDLSQAERDKTMTPAKFQDTVKFIQKTGFKTFYWWGIEFWYWEKTVNNNPFYWEEAKKLFNQSATK
ncbi:MAG: hypothetical protein NTY12_01495 [Candidatus Falkowbacteria bacterium]|nr:hypothetical protein [Candidatus Falkowbacteria bacterium]